MKSPYRYRVTWGGNGVEHYQPCRTWAEACRFMKLLMQEGCKDVGVRKWEE